MSILIDKNTKVLVQGITGKEGGRAAEDMLAYGTAVIGGTSPGKGGAREKNNLPVFNSVAEAMAAYPDIGASMIAVPAPFVFDAAMEAIASRIPLIVILSEKVPVSHVAKIIAHAKLNGVRIVGPSSIGIISPGRAKIGSVGAAGIADRIFSPGTVGVISKSGGMTAELSRILTDAGIGQSTAIGIGGDLLIGTDFVDAALLFEQDKDTKALAIFGEIGGTYEEQLADAIRQKKITKPVVALIAGQFSEQLATGAVLGHAGAIVMKGAGSFTSKIKALREAGAIVAETPEDIPVHLQQLLGKTI
ncbi:MAG: succinate--CoA ligase subunit alpha [Candidatus Sungbacteria bacterium]|nr:succinate--CoA ligase subunit alpha [Candidatus Sungbacteria bacterium]